MLSVEGGAPAPIELSFATASAGAQFLGLPALEGYAIVAGLAVVVAVLIVLGLGWRRRKGRPPPEPPAP
jgi:hypothetical protein